MRMLKKFTAIFLTAVLLFSFSGCGGSKTVTASAKFIAGSPNAPGDFFELELSDANADAPVISGASRQAAADDSIIVTGEGLSTPNLKAYIYSQSKSDNGKAYEAKVTVVDDTKATTNFLAGDIVKDNSINIYDLSAVVAYFGTEMATSEYNKYAKYDLNRDGKIDIMDISMVLTSWGK